MSGTGLTQALPTHTLPEAQCSQNPVQAPNRRSTLGPAGIQGPFWQESPAGWCVLVPSGPFPHQCLGVKLQPPLQIHLPLQALDLSLLQSYF
jgi:hypothetical protein